MWMMNVLKNGKSIHVRSWSWAKWFNDSQHKGSKDMNQIQGWSRDHHYGSIHEETIRQQDLTLFTHLFRQPSWCPIQTIYIYTCLVWQLSRQWTFQSLADYVSQHRDRNESRKLVYADSILQNHGQLILRQRKRQRQLVCSKKAIDRGHRNCEDLESIVLG